MKINRKTLAEIAETAYETYLNIADHNQAFMIADRFRKRASAARAISDAIQAGEPIEITD